jgi:hypothetical protein
MALTPQQQQLADVAQAGEANACCLALGGEIGNYPLTGEELCLMAGANSFPLGDSCGQIEASLPSLPSPGQESGGGFFGWIGDNFQEIVSGATDIIGAIGGGSAPSGGTTPQPVDPVQPQPTQGDNTIYYVLGGVLLLLVIFVLIRKFK